MKIPFHELVRELDTRSVRYVLIGVGGANYYAHTAGLSFNTRDRDLFLPPDPENLLRAWTACEAAGLELTVSKEPLDRPRDLWLAERIVGLRALTRAGDGIDLEVDLTLVMAGFEFEAAWREHRVFEVEGVPLHVARLLHIVESKSKAGRPKDHLFLETHREGLQNLMHGDGPKRPE